MFADIGGDDSLHSGHPFHLVEGTAAIAEGGQAVIAHTEGELQGRRSVVYPVRPDLNSDDQAARDAARWRAGFRWAKASIRAASSACKRRRCWTRRRGRNAYWCSGRYETHRREDHSMP